MKTNNYIPVYVYQKASYIQMKAKIQKIIDKLLPIFENNPYKNFSLEEIFDLSQENARMVWVSLYQMVDDGILVINSDYEFSLNKGLNK